jgi:hypothetical protein
MLGSKYISEKQAIILARYFYLAVFGREAEVQEVKVIIDNIFRQNRGDQEQQRKIAIELLKENKL